MSDLERNSHRLVIDDSIFSHISVDRVKQCNERTRQQLLEEYTFLNENMTLSEMLDRLADYYKKHPKEYEELNAKAKVELEAFNKKLLDLAGKMDND